MPRTAADESHDADAKKAYAQVTTADDRRSGPWGDMQKLAKAFLKWDKTAKAADRRELQNFVSLRMTSENVTWGNEVAFRDTFRRVIASSNQYYPARQDGGSLHLGGAALPGSGDGRGRDSMIDRCDVTIQDQPDKTECRIIMKLLCKHGTLSDTISMSRGMLTTY